jgi:hypothetical protein
VLSLVGPAFGYEIEHGGNRPKWTASGVTAKCFPDLVDVRTVL